MERNALTANKIAGASNPTSVSDSGKMKTAPEVREHQNPGPNLHASDQAEREAPMSISMPELQDQTYSKDELIGRLDEARHYYEHSRYARVQWMIFARQQGMSFHEIGVAMGITEAGARKAVMKACG